jgi:hypothetical protein
MGFDAIILTLTTTALLRHANSRSGLWNLLFRDGLVYFLVTASCNAVPAVSTWLPVRRWSPFLKLHSSRFSTFFSSTVSFATLKAGFYQLTFFPFFQMWWICTVIFSSKSWHSTHVLVFSIATVPAATIAWVTLYRENKTHFLNILHSSIAACRLVIRLQDFHKADPYIHSSQIAGESRFNIRNQGKSPMSPRFTGTNRPEIHVTTDHIVMQDLFVQLFWIPLPLYLLFILSARQ